MQKKYKNKIIYSIGFITTIFIIATALDFITYRYVKFNLELSHRFWNVEAYAMTSVNVPHVVKLEVKKQNLKEYVKAEIEKAGLDWKEVDCLIRNESSWNTEGWLINKGGNSGADRGLWAINSKWHPEVSHACAFSAECSTKEAIRIRKANGNWNQWYGFKRCL
jgi:hypothetical protein